jgi:manganese-dependent inorganic pyrophosphatase
MTEEVVSVPPEANMLEAGRLMRQRGIRALPVVGSDGRVRGLVGLSTLAELYIDETEMTGFQRMPVTVGQLADALRGTVAVGDSEMSLSGGVLIGAMEPHTMVGYIRSGDTIIVGDRRRTQPMALEAGATCLIATGGLAPDADVLDLARARGAAVVVSPHDTYATARLVDLSHRVAEVMDPSPLLVSPDALLAEVAEDLVDSPHREALVVDEDGALLGIVTRTNIARGPKRRVVLLDHNEVAQSAPGVEEAAVIEIVDHHRVGDVQTAGPITFINRPVGATATLVAERYAELGVGVPDPIAGILLAAVLTDTVLLKSPTTTDADVAVAEHLADQLGLDAHAFGMELFRARMTRAEFSAVELVGTDLKEYRTGDHVIAVGQIETVDASGLISHADELRRHMEELRVTRGWDLLMLMVTDVVREGSEIVAVGKTRLVERALGVELGSGTVWMPGVLSRKKQIAPLLLDSAGG